VATWDTNKPGKAKLKAAWGRYLELGGVGPEALARSLVQEPDPALWPLLYQHLLAQLHDTRKRSGVFYTPPALVEWILDYTLKPLLIPGARPRVFDPTCGCGRFLTAAHTRLTRFLAEEGDTEPAKSAATLIYGMDTDSGALLLCKASLQAQGADILDLETRILSGNALLEQPKAAPFDVVLGNPPFLNQLENRTLLPKEIAIALRNQHPGLVLPYTDTAAVLLYRASRLLNASGRLGMVQPQSLLSARDAAPIRAQLAQHHALEALWLSTEAVFPGALALVCALVLGPAAPSITPIRAYGHSFLPLPAQDWQMQALANSPSWSGLIQDALGIPVFTGKTSGTLADLALVTADFRDEYYGILPLTIEQEIADERAFPKLILTGHLEPNASLWGRRAVRFGRRPWLYPRVDAEKLLTGFLSRWATKRLVPKILVATQTRVLEAAVDREGLWLTTTPTLSVIPNSKEDLWKIAALLLSPYASAWAMARAAGSALAPDRIKLSASQLQSLPLPEKLDFWDQAAACLENSVPGDKAALLLAAQKMMAAYSLEEEVYGWWEGKLI
jgi:hypothetical protein